MLSNSTEKSLYWKKKESKLNNNAFFVVLLDRSPNRVFNCTILELTVCFVLFTSFRSNNILLNVDFNFSRLDDKLSVMCSIHYVNKKSCLVIYVTPKILYLISLNYNSANTPCNINVVSHMLYGL